MSVEDEIKAMFSDEHEIIVATVETLVSDAIDAGVSTESIDKAFEVREKIVAMFRAEEIHPDIASFAMMLLLAAISDARANDPVAAMLASIDPNLPKQ